MYNICKGKKSYDIAHALDRLSLIEFSYCRLRNYMTVQRCSGWWRDALVRSKKFSEIIARRIEK